MSVSVVDGDILTFRGMVSSGSKRQSVFVGEFEAPPAGSERLLVKLEREGTEVFSGIVEAVVPQT